MLFHIREEYPNLDRNSAFLPRDIDIAIRLEHSFVDPADPEGPERTAFLHFCGDSDFKPQAKTPNHPPNKYVDRSSLKSLRVVACTNYSKKSSLKLLSIDQDHGKAIDVALSHLEPLLLYSQLVGDGHEYSTRDAEVSVQALMNTIEFVTRGLSSASQSKANEWINIS